MISPNLQTWEHCMGFVEPGYSRKEVDWAGQRLAKRDTLGPDHSRAVDIVNNWRAAHGFPLNSFAVTLAKRAKAVAGDEAIVARRLKRLASIEAKLLHIPRLSLSVLQDIGGCRAILPTVAQAEELAAIYQPNAKGHTAPTAKYEWGKNYVDDPRDSGYRGFHVIHEYVGSKQSTSVWDGLRIEIQIRTALMHAWATADETVSLFTGQRLKHGRATSDWKRFFALTASHFAMQEDRPLVPGTPHDPEVLRSEIARLNQTLTVRRRMVGWQFAMEYALPRQPTSDKYFLLTFRLDPEGGGSLNVIGFRTLRIAQASVEYVKRDMEAASDQSVDVVLVSVKSVKGLRAAYPNYYADTSVFVEHLDRIIGSTPV